MAARLIPLHQQTIVITGASSGIGLATARAAAEAGAQVVLVSRNQEALDAIAAEIRQSGGGALAVAADVGRRDEVERVADLAAERFGAVDTWVNDAGVAVWGRAEEVADADARRLFDTNYWGVVYGSLAAARLMKGRGGAIINMGSIASDAGLPLQAMYSASKHAVKGFTDALRVELHRQREPISVTLLKPGVIATPIADNARNYMDREVRPPPPAYHPHEAARAILYAATHPVRELRVGASSAVIAAVRRWTPGLFDALASGPLAGIQKGPARRSGGAGNLFRPGFDLRELGLKLRRPPRPSLSTRARLHPALTGGLIALGGIAALVLLRRTPAARAARLGLAAARAPRVRRLAREMGGSARRRLREAAAALGRRGPGLAGAGS